MTNFFKRLSEFIKYKCRNFEIAQFDLSELSLGTFSFARCTDLSAYTFHCQLCNRGNCSCSRNTLFVQGYIRVAIFYLTLSLRVVFSAFKLTVRAKCFIMFKFERLPHVGWRHKWGKRVNFVRNMRYILLNKKNN